jgi:hypothetical protein
LIITPPRSSRRVDVAERRHRLHTADGGRVPRTADCRVTDHAHHSTSSLKVGRSLSEIYQGRRDFDGSVRSGPGLPRGSPGPDLTPRRRGGKNISILPVPADSRPSGAPRTLHPPLSPEPSVGMKFRRAEYLLSGSPMVLYAPPVPSYSYAVGSGGSARHQSGGPKAGGHTGSATVDEPREASSVRAS